MFAMLVGEAIGSATFWGRRSAPNADPSTASDSGAHAGFSCGGVRHENLARELPIRRASSKTWRTHQARAGVRTTRWPQPPIGRQVTGIAHLLLKFRVPPPVARAESGTRAASLSSGAHFGARAVGIEPTWRSFPVDLTSSSQGPVLQFSVTGTFGMVVNGLAAAPSSQGAPMPATGLPKLSGTSLVTDGKRESWKKMGGPCSAFGSPTSTVAYLSSSKRSLMFSMPVGIAGP